MLKKKLDIILNLVNNAVMKLKKYLEMSGMTQTRIAGMVGVTPAMICIVASGKKKPGLRLALRISKVTKGKVGPEDWYD